VLFEHMLTDISDNGCEPYSELEQYAG